uniref:golgin subfamily A member 6-like protein 22 n=1 Tax=Osmia lignaria TaxID=473952 RepID=UPI00147971B5|nr:golgin subfamily A member 6-like protein 22 [Osmia lignaria]
MEVGDEIDSDHHPIIVTLKGGEKENRMREEKRKAISIGNWTEQGREKFREGIIWRKPRKGNLEEDMEIMLEEFRKGMESGREKEKKSKRKKGWWDEECGKRKKEVRKVLRDWRKGKEEKESYKKAKKEYSRLHEVKKKEENERFVKEAENAKTDREVWRIINTERKKRGRITTSIKEEEWKNHFMHLLGGTEEKVVLGGEREREVESDEEEEISREEIRKAKVKLKDGKAVGGDGIPNEVWKYGGPEVTEWVWETCNRVWKGEGWPEGKQTNDYRGVTLMPTLYKIYAAVLTERLREEMEG